jgi:transcriptional regulator with XRE-family HTH domain
MTENRPVPLPRPDRADVPSRTRPSPEPLWRHVLGSHLRQLRHERGERLVETADRAGISPQYLSEIERGLKEPSSEMIGAVAGALDTSVGDLVLGVAQTLRASSPARTTGVRAFALAA